LLALALAGAPSSVSAQTSSESIAHTRAAIDLAANQWFGAQRKVADLDIQIQSLGTRMKTIEKRVDKLRTVATARAVELYESNTQALGVMSDTQMGGDPLELGRRAALIGQANSEGQAVIDQLESGLADLDARRTELHTARSTLTSTIRYLTHQRHELDTLLASLELGSAHAEARAELAAALRRHQDEAVAQAATRPTVVALTSSSPVDPPSSPTTVPVVTPPPAPAGTGGVSSVHDEPFLVCTRARESDGNYQVVSSGGTYYGAYQFAPTTWNVTASHLGRLDLVGVLPSQASESDQDQMAWALYQWQGNAPWGGRC
jgi:peptidoglycan hydrolase CwlO-like protein